MQDSINNASMLRVGTILRGIYRIDSYLSSGGFGNTYVATNIEFNERYAVKEFFMKGVTQREGDSITVSVSNSINQDSFLQQKEKFKKEARRLRQLNNPHIVKVHDLFEENGTAYYVMDFVDGENLSERLKRTGQPMSEVEVNKILPQILDALKAVHDAGMWHLDLKPANIMLDKSGQVKLIDFGASKQLNAQKGGATTSTAISYTNGYAPREQMEQNYDKFGPWTDIYAVGATLYNLLTNKRPPLPTDIDDDMSDDKHLSLPMPNVSDKMKQLVLWLMKTNRMQRPQEIQGIKDFKLEEKPKDIAPKDEPKPAERVSEDEETKIAVEKEDEREEFLSSDENNHEQEEEEFCEEENEIPVWKETLKDHLTDLKNILKYVIYLFIFSIPVVLIQRCQMDNDAQTTESVDTVWDTEVEQMPSYPGGENALTTYLVDNIKYPEEAVKKGIEGRVLIKFIVEKDGSISNVEVAEPVNPLLDKEALRVVRSMDNWIPGKQNGKPVRVLWNIPISFRLK